MRPMPTSTASTAVIAAVSTPVCPTMSGLAKLTRMKSNLSDWTAFTTASATPAADISGLWSYVATSFGEGIIARSSPGKASSRPPLKKYVTCAYFSVSAQRNCVRPALAMTSGKMSTYFSLGNAIGSPKLESYVVMHA